MVVLSFWSDSPLDKEDYSSFTSETIPDMSMSVREILQRYSVGAMVIPDIETGEDDTFDTPVDTFEDLVDATDALHRGQQIVDDYHSDVTNSNVANGDVTNDDDTNSNIIDDTPLNVNS